MISQFFIMRPDEDVLNFQSYLGRYPDFTSLVLPGNIRNKRWKKIGHIPEAELPKWDVPYFVNSTPLRRSLGQEHMLCRIVPDEDAGIFREIWIRSASHEEYLRFPSSTVSSSMAIEMLLLKIWDLKNLSGNLSYAPEWYEICP